MMPRILVVDDDTLYAEAVELARELRPDVVVMDVHMPVVDGLEATQRLLDELPGIRVVLVTSSTADEDRRRAREVGAHTFLRKELGSDVLLEATLTAAREEVVR